MSFNLQTAKVENLKVIYCEVFELFALNSDITTLVSQIFCNVFLTLIVLMWRIG